jgi:hypothetical protein
MTTFQRRALGGLAGTLILLVLPASAFGQATRTWVSGVGDDANPCSRTAPCKTFAGAISKTAAKGEINTLDPGGFGGVTITKSITIRSAHNGGVLVSGTNAIVVNAAPTDRVILAGLDIHGLETGLSAVRVLQARDVRVYRSSITGFTRSAIDFVPAASAGAPPAKLLVKDMEINNSTTPAAGTEANGVLVQPAAGRAAHATIVDSTIGGYHNGLVLRGSSRAAVRRTTITDSGNVGVFASGASAVVRLSGSEITNNVFGLSTSSGGQIISLGDNLIHGNDTDGDPTSTVARR